MLVHQPLPENVLNKIRRGRFISGVRRKVVHVRRGALLHVYIFRQVAEEKQEKT